MFRRIMFVPILACGGYLSAQDMTNAQLTAEVKSLRTQLTQVSTNVTKALEATNENSSQIGSLQSKLDVLTSTINEEIRKQNQILNAISEKDSTGRYIPRLSAAMESESFRKDMENAVHRSIRTHGEFEVTNKTNNYERIWINRMEIGISPGQTIQLKVPVGTVTTQLPGREKENWTITAPNYRQGIDLVPASSPSPIIVGPPLYFNPPIYINPPIYSSAPIMPGTFYDGGFPIVYR